MEAHNLKRLLCSVAVLLAGGAVAVRAQSALDGFDPNANGPVYAVAVQPDGKILVGGIYTQVQGVTRNNIARLNPDGSLDTGFNPGTDGIVYSIAVQPDGKILIGGPFTLVAGVSRNGIARLNSDGSLDTLFNPNPDDFVSSIALQPDNKILLGGNFTSLAPNGGGSVSRNYIARVNADGTLDSSFDPNANGIVSAFALQPDGRVLIGGGFTTLAPNGGPTVSRVSLARLNMNGTVDSSFDPHPNSFVQSLALQPDGRILLGGTFTTLAPNGGPTITRNRIARLEPNGVVDPSFDPNASATVYKVRLQADGQILICGQFTTLAPNGGPTVSRVNIARLESSGLLDLAFFADTDSLGIYSIALQSDGKILAGGNFTNIRGQPRNRIARLERDGRVDTSVDPNANGTLFAIALQPDGKILVGGDFTSIGGQPRNHVARLNPDGTVDTSFDPNANSWVYTITVQADGKILVGGFFTNIGGQPRNHVARLNANGTLDTSFDPNANEPVRTMAVQVGGKILVGGEFTNVGGQTRNYLARLNPDGTLDTSFDPNANNWVLTMAVQADGKILVGGLFGTIGGQPRHLIARLNPDGTLDTSFDPNANGSVLAIAVQADGKILVGGAFLTIGEQTRYIARLNPDGTLDVSFDPNANNDVYTITVQADGKILVGGFFSSLDGQIRNRVARLMTDGTLDTSFDPNANDWVNAITVQPDGKILIGGYFTSIGGQTRNRLARISNNIAAFQDLSVTQSGITWTRSGASPELWRVTFELSTDWGATYSFLGNGTRIGSTSTFELTGSSLPTGQNILVRARGFYRSGWVNSSESITESVRNVFITLPPTPTAVVSRKLHGGTPFDINLPLSGNPGIECRSGGATNDYQVIFTFPSAITFTNASVTAGVGSVSGSSGSGTPIVTVNLTGVTNAQRITVTLQGVSDGTHTGDISVQVGMLIGDSNGNGSVNSSDVSQTKGRIGQAVTSTNFRSDINANGAINAGDVSLVKSHLGSALP